MTVYWILFFSMLLVTTTSVASPLALSSGNATITVDPASVFGLSSYTVNGTEEIFEQQFWYRLAAFPYEQPLNTLPLLSASAIGNQIQASFASSNFGVNLTYQLVGGTPGNTSADLHEVVTLRNLSGTNLPIAWYMEADFDLGGFGGQDIAIGGVDGVIQTDGTTLLRVQSSLIPDAFQIAGFPDLFLSLADLSITNLDNTGSPFGPGDATLAYQWNLTIPAGGSITYSVDKQFIPEPDAATLCVVAIGVLAAVRLRRRQVSRHP